MESSLFMNDCLYIYHSQSSSLSVCVSLPVPTPSVSLSVPSGPLYEGTSQTLTCTVTLPEPVDTDVTVGVVWRFTNTQVVNSTRISCVQHEVSIHLHTDSQSSQHV